MTTPQAKIPAARHWEPYPELPREPKDMQQIRPIYYLQETLVSILTPGYSLRDHPTILISGEIPIYYDPTAPATGGAPPHVIPDFLIAFDVDTDAIWRRVDYDPLQNSKPPDLVMDVASRRTHRNDTLHKRDIYQRIGVPEYWRFDPEGGRYYGQVIIGERLVNGQYERFPLVRYDNEAEGSTSAILNLNFRCLGRRFSIHDPTTGAEYEHPQEENARLRAELQRLRGEG
ncbi:MAG: Uma2 family endonuclease [Chloroflexota bacterium]|nr:Uma2 family endonuclease [Rhodospirillaceae bacterium]MDE2960404.1 Uma2 family endonuclease [Chloroflexota bacterium]